MALGTSAAATVGGWYITALVAVVAVQEEGKPSPTACAATASTALMESRIASVAAGTIEGDRRPSLNAL